MVEQYDEVGSELVELKSQLEYKQESLFGDKVDSDKAYQRELRLINDTQMDEVAGFTMEFSSLFEGMKEAIFLDANKYNESAVIAEAKTSFANLEKEIAIS